MVRVSSLIQGPAWPLVAAGAVLATARHFEPQAVPAWLVLVPFLLFLVYAALLIPIVLWSGIEGTWGLAQQRRRINRDDILRHILEKDAERFANGGRND